MTPDARADPRSIVTPDAFSVDEELLGAPLAEPWRRLAAILVDGALIVFVQLLGWRILGGLVGLTLFRLATRRPDGAVGGSGRKIVLGCAGTLVLAVAVGAAWIVPLLVRSLASPNGAPPPAAVADSAGVGAASAEIDSLRARLEEAEEASTVFAWVRGAADEAGLVMGWGTLYMTLFLALWGGRTPGKRVMRVRVVRLNGQPLGLYMSLERAGGYAAGFATGLLGFARIWWDPNRQTIHDKIAETVVLREGDLKRGGWRRRIRGPDPAGRRPAAMNATGEPVGDEESIDRVTRRRAQRPGRQRARSAAAFALAGAAACGGAADGSDSARVSGDASNAAAQSPRSSASQSMPAGMLQGGVADRPPAQEHPLSELGFDFGSPDAPIKVVEFSDYGCGYCRQFHTTIFPALRRDFVDAGRVQWKYVPYASGMFANGLPAAFAAECAGEQEAFEPMSLLLYQRQGEWKSQRDPYPVFEALAREAGADAERFRACFAEERPRARLRSGIISGARMGVRGTPYFLVNGVPLVGAQPAPYWEGLFTRIEEELGG